MTSKKRALKTENVFHQILKEAKLRPPKEVWGLCVSGGMDSVALLQLLVPIAKMTRHQLKVFHIHHGHNATEKQLQFRDGSFKFVKSLCKELGIEFLSNAKGQQIHGPKKQSEDALRDFRWKCLKEMTQSEKLTILTGHHLDDVLETRLIQLIRGVGPEAFTNFRNSSPGVWRPLFFTSQREIALLALHQEWNWFDDPSNKSIDPLRNWIRLEWLPLLEKKRPGSPRSLHRSLELIVDALSETASNNVTVLPIKKALKNEAASSQKRALEETQVLSRPDFETLSRQRQRQMLAQVLKKQGARGYTKGQLEEVLKRLESPQKEFEFKISQMLWKVNNSSIHISRV